MHQIDAILRQWARAIFSSAGRLGLNFDEGARRLRWIKTFRWSPGEYGVARRQSGPEAAGCRWLRNQGAEPGMTGEVSGVSKRVENFFAIVRLVLFNCYL